jgi:hypothetical protein
MSRSIARLLVVEPSASRSDRLSDSHAAYQSGLPQIRYYVPTITAGDSWVGPATAIAPYSVADEKAAR